MGVARCAIGMCVLLLLLGFAGVDAASARPVQGIVLTAELGPVLVDGADPQTGAVNDAEVNGQIALPSPFDCPYFHFHGTLFGKPDPAPQSCGWGPFIPIDQTRAALLWAAFATTAEESGRDATHYLHLWIRELEANAKDGVISAEKAKLLVEAVTKIEHIDKAARDATDPKEKERLKLVARRRKLEVLARTPHRVLFRVPKHERAGGGFEAVAVVPKGQLGNPQTNYDVVVDISAKNAQWDSVEVRVPFGSKQSIRQFLVQGENTTCVLIDSNDKEYQPQPPDNHYDVSPGTQIVEIRCKRSGHHKDFNIAVQLSPSGPPRYVFVTLLQKGHQNDGENIQVGPRVPK